MTAENLLVELGLEELPAYMVTPSEKQLGDHMAALLNKKRLAFEDVQTLSTPRRLVVYVTGLADAQIDLTEDFRGPSKKIALDVDGNFTKAAQGFVRGKGLATDDIEFREVRGEEHIYVAKHETGKAAREVLVGIPEILSAMTFPVNMHWVSNTFEYIRPIRTLTVLLDGEVLDLDFSDIHSDRVSRGHRLFGRETEIASTDSYKEDLRRVFVIADAKECQDMIVSQIKDTEKAQNVQIEIDDKLLNEVLNLVGYSTTFMGSFDMKYLEVSEEVLVASTKNHQRYFVVRDQADKLVSNFISARNGDAKYLESVIKGNEKVLMARSEDDEFFWREDQKLEITDLVAKSDNVTFRKKIDSLSEHMKRSKVTAAYLTEKTGASAEESRALARATEIYKFDLLTGIVGESDELQGIIGEKYTLLTGGDAAAATAVREHHLLNSADGGPPETRVGALLALANKLDTILSFFSVDLIPSGSNDPYALRRAAAGVARIMDAFGLKIPMDELIGSLYVLLFDSLTCEHKAEVMDFIRARVEKMISKSVSKDIKEAILAGSNFIVAEMLEAADALVETSKAADYKAAVESLPRVFNLAGKVPVDVTVDIGLFENDEEKALAQAAAELNLSGSANDKLAQLFALSPVIDKFFDNTVVMVDNEATKNDRLAILAELTAKASSVAAFNELNIK